MEAISQHCQAIWQLPSATKQCLEPLQVSIYIVSTELLVNANRRLFTAHMTRTSFAAPSATICLPPYVLSVNTQHIPTLACSILVRYQHFKCLPLT